MNFGRNLFLFIALSLVGCNGAPELPLTGGVTLQFVQATQSSIHFTLANQSKQILVFRGTYDKSRGASPWDTLVECKLAPQDPWNEGPFALVDGGRHTVEVSPGEQLDLIVASEFAKQYKGGRCRLSLRLEDESSIESNEFVLEMP